MLPHWPRAPSTPCPSTRLGNERSTKIQEELKTKSQEILLERTQQRLAEIKELSLSQRKMAELHRQSSLMLERSFDEEFSTSYSISCSDILPLTDFRQTRTPSCPQDASFQKALLLQASRQCSRSTDVTTGFEDNLRFVTFGYSVFALPLQLIDIDFCQFVSPNAMATLERVSLSRNFTHVEDKGESLSHPNTSNDDDDDEYMDLSGKEAPNFNKRSRNAGFGVIEAGLSSRGERSPAPSPVVKVPVVVERQSVIRPSSVPNPENKQRQDQQGREKMQFVQACYRVLSNYAGEPDTPNTGSGTTSKSFRRKIAHCPYPGGHLPVQLPRWLLCRHFKSEVLEDGDATNSVTSSHTSGRLAHENISLYKVSDQRCLAFELSPDLDSDQEEEREDEKREKKGGGYDYELNLPLVVIWNDLVDALQTLHRAGVVLRSLSPLVVLVAEGVTGAAGSNGSAPRKHLGARAEIDVSWGMTLMNGGCHHPLPLPLSSKGDLTVYGTSRPDLFHVLGEYNLFIPPEIVKALDSDDPLFLTWSKEADYWSLGVTIMLFCLTALKGKCPADIKTVVVNTEADYQLKLGALRREFTQALQEVIASCGSEAGCLANGPFSGMCVSEAEFFLKAVPKLLSTDPHRRKMGFLVEIEDKPTALVEQHRSLKAPKREPQLLDSLPMSPKQRYLLAVNKLKLTVISQGWWDNTIVDPPKIAQGGEQLGMDSGESWALPDALERYSSAYNLLRQQLIYQPHLTLHSRSGEDTAADDEHSVSQPSLKDFILEFIAGTSATLNHSRVAVTGDQHLYRGPPPDSVLPELLPLLVSPQCPSSILRSVLASVENAAVE